MLTLFGQPQARSAECRRHCCRAASGGRRGRRRNPRGRRQRDRCGARDFACAGGARALDERPRRRRADGRGAGRRQPARGARFHDGGAARARSGTLPAERRARARSRPVRLAGGGGRAQRLGSARGRGAGPGGRPAARVRAPRQPSLGGAVRAGDRARAQGSAGRLAHRAQGRVRGARAAPVRCGACGLSGRRPAARAEFRRQRSGICRSAGWPPRWSGSPRSGRRTSSAASWRASWPRTSRRPAACWASRISPATARGRSRRWRSPTAMRWCMPHRA